MSIFFLFLVHVQTSNALWAAQTTLSNTGMNKAFTFDGIEHGIAQEHIVHFVVKAVERPLSSIEIVMNHFSQK